MTVLVGCDFGEARLPDLLSGNGTEMGTVLMQSFISTLLVFQFENAVKS